MTSPALASSKRPAAGDLNEANIKNAQPGDVLRDEALPGLHLRVFDNRKSFYLWFRTKTRQERRPKLGDHGVITLSQARKIAKEMLGQVAAGGDPIAIREGAKNEPTLADLWAEYWKRRGSKIKSAAWDEDIWEKIIEPKLGSRKLSAITYIVADDLHKSMDDRPVRANRTMALLSKMFNFAKSPLRWYAGVNPCEGVSRNKESKRRRKASSEELARLVARLRRELEGPNVATAAFLWLLLFTGARKGEIAHAKWSNLQGDRILLDEHKTDDGGYARIIYVPQAAREMIDKYLPVTKGSLTGIVSPTKLWQRIRREEKLIDANGVYLTLHDLRRSFASVALSTGLLSLEQVMQMLGHVSAQTTKTYAWLMEDAHATAVNLVAGAIEQKLLPAPEPA